jgi:Arc/MetJ-type ribon-helix-helix transcriptional regulator
MAMRRTTIVADEDVLERLREERVSMAEVIRDALRARIDRPHRRPSFIGALDEPWEHDPGHPTAEEMGEWVPEPASWRHSSRPTTALFGS